MKIKRIMHVTMPNSMSHEFEPTLQSAIEEMQKEKLDVQVQYSSSSYNGFSALLIGRNSSFHFGVDIANDTLSGNNPIEIQK